MLLVGKFKKYIIKNQLNNMWNFAIISFLIIFIASAIFAIANRNTKKIDRPLENYFFSSGNLKRYFVINLLLSTSFGLNPLFFQIWLGYSVGAWGLVTQLAWAIGFVLLAPYSTVIENSNSMHEVIGVRFGSNARIIASICSIIGIIFMMGWESGVGESAYRSIFSTSTEFTVEESNFSSKILISAIVFGSLFYTLLGGLRGNASADAILNLSKFVLVIILTYFVLMETNVMSNPNFWDKAFPSFTAMRNNLGLWGLITNVIFSLLWQFVDNSTWQSIIGGSKEGETHSNLRWSGFASFVAPGIIGTFLGICLAFQSGVNTDNIFSVLINILTEHKTFAIISIFLIVVACVMSMLDGLFLTSSYTLVIDIFYPKEKLSNLDEDTALAEKELLKTRVILVVIAIIAIWGVKILFVDIFKLNLFQYIYLVIISQLSLIGPIYFALATKRIKRISVVYAIILSLIIGFGFAAYGTIEGKLWATDGAGTFTIIASFIFTLLFTKPKTQIIDIQNG